jgi:RNA recognition motif. (a.k.a. RRM, RBD, or RNP domain)
MPSYASRFGYVMDVYMPRDKHNRHEHRGFGFVTFETEAAVHRVAAHGLHQIRVSSRAHAKGLPAPSLVSLLLYSIAALSRVRCPDNPLQHIAPQECERPLRSGFGLQRCRASVCPLPAASVAAWGWVQGAAVAIDSAVPRREDTGPLAPVVGDPNYPALAAAMNIIDLVQPAST